MTVFIQKSKGKRSATMSIAASANSVFVLVVCVFVGVFCETTKAFSPINFQTQHGTLQRRTRIDERAPFLALSSSKNGDETTTDSSTTTVEKDMNPLTRASWYAVEAFGKVFGGKKEGQQAESSATTSSSVVIDLSRAPLSIDETLERIQLDNDRSYFLSGEVDKLIYDEQCTFSDPFVAFDGRDRFVDNLANLGSFITKYDAKMLDYTVNETSSEVNTKVMVKLQLNLPWKPVLAWPWGVKYSIDSDTNLITNHAESWDIEAWEGVKQIFRKPTVQLK